MRTLREILKEKGISQDLAAQGLGIHVSNIKRYDDLRKRSLIEIKIISDSTGIPLSDLIIEGTGLTIEKNLLADFEAYDKAVNKPTRHIVEMMNNEIRNSVTDSVPYEFVRAMIEERKRYDEMNAELIQQNRILIDILKKEQKSVVPKVDSADYADAK